MGNGEYDEGEQFDDINGDGLWTDEEEFEDTNRDGVWTRAEDFEDTNQNNIWDMLLPEEDKLLVEDTRKVQIYQDNLDKEFVDINNININHSTDSLMNIHNTSKRFYFIK